MKLFFKKHLIVYVTVAIFAVIIVISFLSGQKGGESYETVSVKKTDLTQEVEVTGKVRPTQERFLAFERSGKIKSVKVSVGDIVEGGQVLASLDTSEMQAQLRQSEADVVREENILVELQRGSRPEELAIARTTVSNAERTLQDTKTAFNNVTKKADTDLISAYDGTFTSAQSSVVSAKNALVVISEIQQTRFTEPGVNASALIATKSKAIEELFNITNAGGWTAEFVSDLSGGVFQEVQSVQIGIIKKQKEEEMMSLLTQTQKALSAVLDTLEAVPVLSTLSSAEKADISNQKTIISTALATLSAKLQIVEVQKAANASSLANALSGVTTAENALQQSKNELALKEAGSTLETLASQTSRVNAAYAAKELIQAQINTTVLRSPIKGVVTKQELREGVFVQAGLQVVSIISKGSYETEIFVPEVDISKISIDDNVNITLDAYTDEDIFLAKVSLIDPAETTIEGVATYKATLGFLNSEDVRIKSGMTANAIIFADERKDVLAVPLRAIIIESSQKYVRVLEGKEVKKVVVETGMKSSDGQVEILSGLKGGEIVITFVVNN